MGAQYSIPGYGIFWDIARMWLLAGTTQQLQQRLLCQGHKSSQPSSVSSRAMARCLLFPVLLHSSVSLFLSLTLSYTYHTCVF